MRYSREQISALPTKKKSISGASYNVEINMQQAVFSRGSWFFLPQLHQPDGADVALSVSHEIQKPPPT
jgi:hypothetical protein